jgi:hypothetical protein
MTSPVTDEFLRSGQTSLPAYVLGERIYGAVIVMLLAVGVGVAAGLVVGATRTVISRLRH